MRTFTRQCGFSVLELLATLGIFGVVAAVTVPSTARTLSDLRISGAARSLHNTVALAKMRAAARFTRERIFVDLTENSYQLQYLDKDAGKWVNEESGTVTLPSGVTFGYGSIATPPTDTQTTIGQSPNCKVDLTETDMSNTACIVFNSRGIPVVGSGANSSEPTGESALYITDGFSTYGVTLSATPLIRLWWTRASDASWVHR